MQSLKQCREPREETVAAGAIQSDLLGEPAVYLETESGWQAQLAELGLTACLRAQGWFRSKVCFGSGVRRQGKTCWSVSPGGCESA